jgi:hypothetical protein
MYSKKDAVRLWGLLAVETMYLSLWSCFCALAISRNEEECADKRDIGPIE